VRHISIGSHSLQFEPPNVCVITYRGDIVEDEVAELFEAIRLLVDSTKAFFFIIDLRQQSNLTPAARKRVSQELKAIQPQAVAIIGASFPVRVLVILIEKAAGVLSKADRPFNRFFDAEADARAWIEERRRMLDELGATPRE
jgi:hypothetical protein